MISKKKISIINEGKFKEHNKSVSCTNVLKIKTFFYQRVSMGNYTTFLNVSSELLTPSSM